MDQTLLLQLVRRFELKLTDFITGEKLCDFDSSNEESLERLKRIICEELIEKEFISNKGLNPSMVIEAFDIAIGNIKDTLKEKINPILFLSQNSQKKLSYIKNHLKSKNDNKIKNIMRKKSLMGILIDKEFFKNMKRLSVPKYIELPKNFQDKKKFYE